VLAIVVKRSLPHLASSTCRNYARDVLFLRIMQVDAQADSIRGLSEHSGPPPCGPS
jgi:hypothetical protein